MYNFQHQNPELVNKWEKRLNVLTKETLFTHGIEFDRVLY